MSRLAALPFLFLFVVQGYGLEDPTPDKIEGFKNMVAEWAKTAQRIGRSLHYRPQEDAEGVSAQLRAAMEEGRRHKRETPPKPSTDFENLLSGLNDSFQNIIKNITSSPLYGEVLKAGESFNTKGKDIVKQLTEQVKNFQSKKEN